MISKENVINQILNYREYGRKSHLEIYLTDLVDLGDGDCFFICTQVALNRFTGTVCFSNSVRFRGCKKVHPRKNCGRIDLSDLSDEVYNRYSGYLKRTNSSFRNRRKPLRS